MTQSHDLNEKKNSYFYIKPSQGHEYDLTNKLNLHDEIKTTTTKSNLIIRSVFDIKAFLVCSEESR